MEEIFNSDKYDDKVLIQPQNFIIDNNLKEKKKVLHA